MQFQRQDGLGKLPDGSPAPAMRSRHRKTRTHLTFYSCMAGICEWTTRIFAETAFKRLYWQGYQGRFGSFRWRLVLDFSGIISVATTAATMTTVNPTAWASGVGLLIN